jgi:Transposase IS116/IS110/IS902 family
MALRRTRSRPPAGSSLRPSSRTCAASTPSCAAPGKKLDAAIRASGTSLTGLFGVGPVIAATVIGDVRDVSGFKNRGRFAAYNGTAPIEVSSGGRRVHRPSRRGNRRVNHAIHMAAVTQARQPRSDGRAYYDKKLAEGKADDTPYTALRAIGSRPGHDAAAETSVCLSARAT